MYRIPGTLLVLATLALFSPGWLPAAQGETGFVPRVYKDNTGEHKYTVFIPRGYSTQKKWPAVLFLHGAGERGVDGTLPTTVGLGPAIRARDESFPFVAIFPQCEDTKGRILTAWSPDSPDGQRALKILKQVEQDYSIDPKRVVLTGWSMGGYGAFQMAAAHPELFSGVAALSAGADSALASRINALPLWIFHGGRDAIVRVDESRKIVAALKQAGSRAWYTEIPQGDHYIWQTVFAEDALIKWMAAPTNDGQPPVIVRSQQRQGAIAGAVAEPFVPALDIPHAVYVRMGNDMLASLADAIPKVVASDVLSGRLNDISDYTSTSGYTFGVYFTNLSYSAQLTRASVKAYSADRLNVQLGVSNLQIVIGSTYLNGANTSKSAAAGPITISIGHMRPVWISFDVTPYIEDRKLKLRFVNSHFSIPDDNWYVTPPAGVDAHGWGMTEEKVSSGLVSGLYGQKYRIEEQVNSVIPSLLGQIEQRLDLSQADKAVANIWPLPVYRPRLRTWPDQVVTDDKGISISLGVTVAAFDPKIQNKWRITQPVAPGASAVPAVPRFQFGIAPQILGPLSKMLQEVNAARIHVLDTPSKSMSQLVDRRVMAEIIPDLQRHGEKVEIWTELALNSQLQVVDSAKPWVGNVAENGQRLRGGAVARSVAAESGPTAGRENAAKPVPARESTASNRFSLVVPKLTLYVSYKTDTAATKFTPCAEFDVTVRQNVLPKMERPTSITRGLSLILDDHFEVKVDGRFAPGYQPQNSTLNNDRFAAIFREGWHDFTLGGPGAATILPDIDLGYTKLRAALVEWSEPFLATTYGPAGVKLTNGSNAPLIYETKGPYSDWGEPLTLKPGMTHEYDIAYPLLFRRQSNGEYELYTLPAGSHSEFFVAPTGGPPKLYQARERPAIAPPTPDVLEKNRQASPSTSKSIKSPSKTLSP